jgi:hypothetical protein
MIGKYFRHKVQHIQQEREALTSAWAYVAQPYVSAYKWLRIWLQVAAHMVTSGCVHGYKWLCTWFHVAAYMVTSGCVYGYKWLRKCIHMAAYMVTSGCVHGYKWLRKCIRSVRKYAPTAVQVLHHGLICMAEPHELIG